MLGCPAVNHLALAPVRRLFAGCSYNLAENTVWWVRIVGHADACRWLLEVQDKQLGFGVHALDVTALIAAVNDTSWVVDPRLDSQTATISSRCSTPARSLALRV